MANTATLKSAKPHTQPAATEKPSLPASPEPALAFAMLSHPGLIRRQNQDACGALPECGAFVVCDGVGGAAAGEVASRLAADAFLESLSHPCVRPHRRMPPRSAPRVSTESPDSTPPPPQVDPPDHPRTRLQQAVEAANDAVFRHSRRAPTMRGMGTTLVAALWDESDPASLWLANVGDSRCYRLRAGKLALLTDDHSLVEEQVRAGLISRAQASTSPIRNIITRAVGSLVLVEPDIASHATQPGDLYLLASDGLTRELTDAEIAAILTQPRATGTTELEAICQTLVDAANASGGRDNITVLLIACP